MGIGLVAPLTNGAYGVGRGGRRRVKPFCLMCIHVTGNSRTAANHDLHAAAIGERNYANRAYDTVIRNGVAVRVPARGPSATGYVARDGWAVLAVDPDRFFPWSNGDISSPHTANPGIRRVLALHAKGYNGNEAYWEEWELLGFGTRFPITPAQERFIAERIAARSHKSGIPINRETVHGHWEINGVDRRNCPVPYAQREIFLNRVIALARSIDGAPAPAPKPVPAPTPAPKPAEEIVKTFAVSEQRQLVPPLEDPARPGHSHWFYTTSELKADGKEISLDPKPFRPLVVVGPNIVPGVTAVAYETAAGDTDGSSWVYFIATDHLNWAARVVEPSAAEAKAAGIREGARAVAGAGVAKAKELGA